jgi:HSP20 family protein
MAVIRRVSPFGDLLSLRQAMDRLFEESYVNPTWRFSEGQIVPMDVWANDDAIEVQAILPGVKPEEVEITVEGETLTITGDTTASAAPEKGSILLQEIRRGRFSRTLTLPAGLEPDKATATFEDGVLTLRIPKAEQSKPRQIKISTSGQDSSGQMANGNGRHETAVETK